MHVQMAGEGQLSGFTYFWAKPVYGFIQTKHCAGCLDGPYDKRFHPKMKLGRKLEIQTDAPYFYLCGVTYKVSYVGNLHVAMVPAKRGKFVVETWFGGQVIVTGAKRIEIEPLPDGWKDLPEPFTRCRNFQFGVQEFGYS